MYRLAALAALASALVTVPAAAQRCAVPRVLLTVDRSSSMLGLATDGLTKWDAAETAIGEVTSAYEGSIDFGLQVFPYPNRCEPGHVVLDFAMHASSDVVDALGGPPPDAGNYTPMAQTLDEAATTLGAAANGVHLILVTDGWQWCDPYDPSTRFTPVAAVERLRALGVTVHVVGFGASVDPVTLNRAAVAAGTARPGCDPSLSDPAASGHCYEQVGDLAELRAALEGIARLVTEEMCDGLDTDCDGTIDEGFDVDDDGYTVCGSDVVDGGTDPTLVDCDDAAAAVNPGALEVCNLIDDDCDGMVDPECSCSPGDVVDCGSDLGACSFGTSSCEAGEWGACMGADLGSAELCNGIDDDCDGAVDDGAMSSCEAGQVCLDGGCVDLTPDEPVEPMMPPDDETMPRNPNRGGCACSVPVTSGGSAGLALSVGLGLMLVLARRRR